MAKYNSKSVYGTLFTMLDNLSEENQDYLMENVFDGDFLEDVKSNPKKAYDVLNKVVINIEDGKKDKVSELLSEYKDKIYMMKNMLKDYGNFKEKKSMAKYDWKVEPRDEDWSDDTYTYFLIHINLKKMVEYLTKEFKNDWWFKADYGQDNCYIVAENNNFPVRLFFTFEEGGWADITRHYTDGATLKDDHLGSWHFGKYDVDYSYAVIRDNIENYFYKFEESMKENKDGFYYIAFYGTSGDGYVGYDNEPTNDIDNAMQFDTEKEAEKEMKKLQNEWESKLSVEYFSNEINESKNGNKKSLKESEYDDYVNLDNLHFGYNDEYGFMEFGFYKNIQIKYDNGYTIIFGQLPSKEWAFAITDVSKGEGNLIDSQVNFVKKDTLVDLNHALKNLGIDKTWNELSESKKSARKSLKEYRTVGFEQLVRDTIVEVLEDPHSDLFDLGMADGIITYNNKGCARITSNGDVDMDFITLPTYFWSSGKRPSNKKTAKLIEDIMESNMEYAKEGLWRKYKDELIGLGITSKDDEKLNYSDLTDMGADDLAEELSKYEMDLEGTDLYTDVYCQLEETDEGIELTVSMTVQDEYGHVLVKDYKSNTVLLQEDTDALEEFITDAIREVTEQF